MNIINFDGNENAKRKGSQDNIKLIKQAFEYHGFQVSDHCDLDDYQVLNLSLFIFYCTLNSIKFKSMLYSLF